jgi:hypothetical protein
MAVKGKRGRRTQKSSLRHRRNRSRAVSIVSRKRQSIKRQAIKRQAMERRTNCIRRLKGGNYETDVTMRTIEGVPTKPANKVVTTVPGYGTMSAAAYINLMEDKDRNGSDYYD